jgi:hypothetical protein
VRFPASGGANRVVHERGSGRLGIDVHKLSNDGHNVEAQRRIIVISSQGHDYAVDFLASLDFLVLCGNQIMLRCLRDAD